MKQQKSILIKNIYYMLSYAFRILRQSNFSDIATEEFDNVQNLFAAILSKGIGGQLKQGLYREYENKLEDIPTMHGRIDMHGTIRHKIAREQVLTCEYDELSENNLLNQILKTTVMLLLGSREVDTEYKDILKKEMLYFSDIDLMDPHSIQWDRICFHRNNQTYQMLISLCQLILQGMLLTTERGENRLASFVDEQRMCRLYEKFILEYYSREFPRLHVSASQISWALDDGAGTMLPVMQSDITLSYKNTVLIIDAKYYSRTTQEQYGVHTLHSNNMYQIFTYVKNKDMEFADKPHTVAGMLLYARTDESIQPNQSYQMSGNRIDVKTLDLNQEFSLIAQQLNQIATDLFEMKQGA
ncbi:MAG: 5-methylcytosine-specific restriction endonuclease system specificity protein McrC [Oscillospiraceae bacterium]|nr:5-methylcytosine-specific restriction endonuclease system specificity protein McrC [Oscillospiraceae bacterium]